MRVVVTLGLALVVTATCGRISFDAVVDQYDYVDHAVPMLARMFEKRLRGYRSIGYACGEAPLGYAEPKELAIEYDADVDLDADADA